MRPEGEWHQTGLDRLGLRLAFSPLTALPVGRVQGHFTAPHLVSKIGPVPLDGLCLLNATPGSTDCFSRTLARLALSYLMLP